LLLPPHNRQLLLLPPCSTLLLEWCPVGAAATTQTAEAVTVHLAIHQVLLPVLPPCTVLLQAVPCAAAAAAAVTLQHYWNRQ
jgi:hypothetical protein